MNDRKHFSRYARQIRFAGVGEAGQEKLRAAHVLIVGIGALGTVASERLARAGVGHLRLVDRDYVDESNLQRQALFTEDDAREERPKALAAASHLARINGETALEPLAVDLQGLNAEALLCGMDLALDCTDNFETRFILNEACVKTETPWIYGGAAGGAGASMNIVPGGPCLRCLIPLLPAPGSYPSCASEGALNMATALIGAYQASEALKMIVGAPSLSRRYFSMDLWNNRFAYMEAAPDPACPVCARGEYELLGKPPRFSCAALCGEDAMQLVPGGDVTLDLAALAEGLKGAGAVRVSPFLMSFEGPGAAFKLFPDGRAIIKGAADEKAARAVYAQYVGM
ncbi:MAG: ThiF family adenylyltransferase [Treponema sp.]|jgi:adenylyltransferase/sulfurtransferase|nr:ThiF family adenylyltransferase [Treponema sp.]